MSESDLQTQIDALREQVNRVMQAFSAMDIPEELSNVEDAVGESEGVDSSALDEIQQRVGLVESLARRRDPMTPKMLSAASRSFYARITASTFANGTATAHATNPATQWTYTFVEVEKTVAGYSVMTASARSWTDLSGGRTGTARNTIEDINTLITDTLGGEASRMGNGVVLANLDYDTDGTYDFPPRPVPDEVIVQVHEVSAVVAGVSSTEYWFSYENGVDGSC